MREFLYLFWECLSITVSWMPQFCLDFLAVVAFFVVAFIMIPLLVKLVQLSIEAIK